MYFTFVKILPIIYVKEAREHAKEQEQLVYKKNNKKTQNQSINIYCYMTSTEFTVCSA